MISRRNFLKIAGLSTVAVGAGFTTGRLTSNKNSVHFAVHGFIPNDEQVMSQIVAAFKNKVRSSSEPVVLSDSKIGEVISRLDTKLRNDSFSNRGTITYQLKKIEEKLYSDIIVSDDSNPVYSLNDMTAGFSNIRANIINRKAEFLFTAEYKEQDFLSSLFGSNKKEVVIENHKRIVERIPVQKEYKNIVIDGLQGKTGLKIENGIAQVHTSSCRNGICKHAIATGDGSIIACAPNKVLIKIV
jgi:hypothetical protein